MAEARPAWAAAPSDPAARGRARGLPLARHLSGTHAERVRPPTPVLRLKRSSRVPSSCRPSGCRTAPPPPPPPPPSFSTCYPRSERGNRCPLSGGTATPHALGIRVPSAVASRYGPPARASRPRAQAPLSPERGARRQGYPGAGGSGKRPQAIPVPPGQRSSGGCRLPLTAPPRDPHFSTRAPPLRPGLPPSPGTAARRGTKRRSPAPLPAGGAYLQQGRQQHQRQRRQDPRRRRSRYSAHGGEEGRRQGGPQQSRSAAGAPGAGRREQWVGSSSGSCWGAADGVCPRLPEPAAAALPAGCRSSSWAAMQRGKRETERERERRRMGETQLWVRLFFPLPSPLRGAESGQRRGGGWANKRLGDKKEVVAAARPVRRRLLSAGSLPHAWIVPASLLPPVPPSELGQAAPLSASARARQHRRCSGPSPAACSPRTFSLSPSFFSSLHPSPCTQTPPLKHNDNNTPAASACRACVYALARCLPACCCWQLPLRLPSLPVGRTANGNGTARQAPGIAAACK